MKYFCLLLVRILWFALLLMEQQICSENKSSTHMMACVPKAYFLEHFTMQLCRESAANLLEKLLDCKLHLLGSIRPPAPGCLLARWDDITVVDVDGNLPAIKDAENQRGFVHCSKKEHFVNPPLFTFCSNSPSVMAKIRRDCLTAGEFVFACIWLCASRNSQQSLHGSPHKLFPSVKRVLKQILFMVKTLKSSHLLLQLYNKLCLEKYKKTNILVLFTKTGWGTVFYAAQRANLVKSACAALPEEILNSDLDIDTMCDKLKQLVTDPVYWKGVTAMEALFKTTSSCCMLASL